MTLNSGVPVNKLSSSEELFAFQFRAAKVPQPEREHRFHVKRRWRFDFAWVDRRLAVEVEGVSRGISRHQTIAGYRADCEKYNEAALAGWRVLRFTQREISSGEALQMVERALST